MELLRSFIHLFLPQSGLVSRSNSGLVTGKRNRLSFEDWLELSEIAFEWADSYDAKDWNRLRAILAPTLEIDYTEVNGNEWKAMPAEDFVKLMSHPGFLGDTLVHTQHHIGTSKWEKVSETEAVGYHQLRAAHQRYTGHDHLTVENKGHGHALIRHLYKKVNGSWKFAGLRPTVRWNEYAFDKIFVRFDGHAVKEPDSVAMDKVTKSSALVVEAC